MAEQRKKILLLVHTFADAGGTQRLFCDLGEALAERYEVFECAFDANREPRIFSNTNPVLTLDAKKAKSTIGRFIGYATKAYRLNRIKKRYQIDVTISGLWPADFINVISMGRGRRV